MQSYAITIVCDPEICSREINYCMDRRGVGGRRRRMGRREVEEGGRASYPGMGGGRGRRGARSERQA